MHILYKEEDNGYVGMFFQPQLQKPELILEFKKWSLKDSRRYKKVWEVIKKNLKDAGITEVYSLCESEKAVKFNKFWGFKDTGFIAQTKSNKLNYILKLEI
jgi:hypothetical protein